MTDRELLELAAKAAGLPLTWEHIEERADCKEGDYCFLGQGVEGVSFGKFWNPLIDDGDALRLAVKLNIDLLFNPRPHVPSTLANYGNPYAATRRAIVRAAAEIGCKQGTVPASLSQPVRLGGRLSTNKEQ